MPYLKVNRHACSVPGEHSGAMSIVKPRVVPSQVQPGRAKRNPPDAVGDPLVADPGTIGGRLVICRTARKLTQKDAAKRIGITAQSLGGLERGGSKQPAASTLLEMRDRLGYDPDYVMRGRGMPLMPNFEDMARESMLISIFRELKPRSKDGLLSMAQTLRRAEGNGPSGVDPFETDPPNRGNDD